MLKVERFIQFKNIFFVVFIAICSLVLSSCISDDYDEGDTTRGNFDEQLMLTFVVPNMDVATRADEGYEDGSVYENLIDINNHDYRIYFFSYEGEEDETAGTLIAQFTPTRTVTSTSENVTHYTISGKVPDELLEVNSFRVVVLANWDNKYPNVVEDTTTIDDLTEGEYTTFLAENKFVINADNLIPFYGVQEFTGVSFNSNETIELEKEVYLLRALAKVEIVLTNEDDLSFSKVILHNYNGQGYSAPKGIYLSNQYHTGTWNTDYVQTLHLVGDTNENADNGEGISFTRTKEREVDATTGVVTQHETWDLYIPEYDNSTDADSAAYIDVLFDYQLTDDDPYQIFFQDYDETSGKPIVGSVKDIYRNNLYRFNVSLGENYLKVNVQDWESVFDNDSTYGQLSQIIPAGDDIPVDDGDVIYTVLSDEDGSNDGLTVRLKHVENRYEFEIPETIHYLGYDYTVVSIGENCFKGDESIVTIIIPATVTNIDSEAFSGDTGLVSITLYGAPPTCEDDAFENDTIENITLYVLEDYFELYESDTFWNQFNIEIIED